MMLYHLLIVSRYINTAKNDNLKLLLSNIEIQYKHNLSIALYYNK